MSLEQADRIIQHPSVIGISRRRRLYAAFVLSAAILIVLLVCLSFSVSEFRSVRTIRLVPKSAGAEGLDQAQRQALQVIRELTSEDQLRAVVSIWTDRLNQAMAGGGLDPDQVDYEKLRSRLTFAVDPDPAASELTLQIGYCGRGNLEEQAFLKLFSERVGEELRRWGSPTPDQIAGLQAGVNHWEKSLEASQQRLDELQLALGRQADLFQRIREFPFDQLLGSGLETGRSDNHRADSPAAESPSDPRRVQLETKLAELTNRAEGFALQFPESHPEVLTLRREREQVQLELMELEQSAPKRISNQFVQAAFPQRSQLDSTLVRENFLELLEAASPEDLPTTLELVRREQVALSAISRNHREAIDAFANATPQLNIALGGDRVDAIGSVTLSNFGWALLAAVVMGSAIASRFDIWSFDRGFENSRAAEEQLAVPVYGWNEAVAGSGGDSSTSASTKILKLGEIILFTTLLVLAGLLLIDLEYRAAVVENPLHLFARLLWMWKL